MSRPLEHCVNCPSTGQGRAGTLADNTPPGWVLLMSQVKEFTYLCLLCGAKADELALRLKEIVKDKHFSYYALLVHAQKRKKEAAKKLKMAGVPTAKYQCVSRPGECKFEWNCGPCCACHVQNMGSKQEKLDIEEAERRQEAWRATRKDA